MAVRILQGDCRETLQQLAEASVHCCVTSPPYWGLRDYGTAPLSWPAFAYSPLPGLPACVEIPAMQCSLGLEPTLEAFIGHMVLVFREVRRVLRDDGTAWVNMGDSYAGTRGREQGPTITSTGRKTSSFDAQVALRNGVQKMVASRRRDDEPIPRSDVRIPGLKPKDLVGQPWRLAFALQADGWWLRSDVIWHKPNPMPESTKDRPTKAHEYIFLLSKSERYYYDAEAIKEPASEETHARYASAKGKKFGMSSWEGRPRYEQAGATTGLPPGRKPVAGWASGGGDHSAIAHAQESEDRDGRKLLGEGAYGDGKSERLGREPGWRARKLAAADSGTKNNESFDAAMAVMPEKRNKRSVWTVVTEGFPEAHFATFPTKLIEPAVLAGTSEKGCCPTCAAPWERRTGRPCEACNAFIPTQGKSCGSCGHVRDWKADRGVSAELNATEWSEPGRSVPRKLTAAGKQAGVPAQESMVAGWTATCDCPEHEPVPCTVLDCFGGSGTTGLVADRHQRNAVLCELNPEYAAMAGRRVQGDAPLFSDVAAA